MRHSRARIGRALIEHFGPDDRRIEHALRVLHHSERIADGRTDCDADVLIASALLHDIGIKLSEQKLGYNNGKTQEEYGPPEAERLLLALGFPPDKTEKVKQIIGNHHSPSRYDYPELAVLKEADTIVNRDDSD
jgi:HD superfamily phosphodiesterase